VSIPVFYATDRQREGGNAAPVYTRKRRYASGIEYGQCSVTLPSKTDAKPYYKLGWRAKDVTKPKARVDQVKSEFRTPDDFFEQIQGRLGASDRLILFVHGYNNSMDVALQRAAELALAFHSPAIAYSWPSNERLLDYTKDECNAEWSLPHFRKLLADLENRFGADHITIVAHSMGNRLLMWSLNARAEANEIAHRSDRIIKFPDIVLTSPDIDSGTFKNYAEHIASNADQTWVLISTRDKALKASKAVHGRNRLGASSDDGVDTDWRQPPIIRNLKTINFTALDTGYIGHSVQPQLIGNLARTDSPGGGLELHQETAGQYEWWRVIKVPNKK
jgi:esterase/lipase superfamily enzyme